MIRKWLAKSFSRQVAVMLLLVGFISNSIYAAFEFYQEYRHYRNFMEQQAIQLSDTLSQTLANDVHYKNYFNLWSEIQKVYQNNRIADKYYSLIIINEIAVVNLKGKILAHTQPKKYKLNSVYQHPLLENKNIIDEQSIVTWMNEHNKLFIYSSIIFNNTTVGYMLISYNTLPLKLLRNRSLKAYVITQLIIFSLIVFISSVFTKKISMPLNKIINAIPDMGSGKVEINFLNHRQDEFKILVEALKKADKNIYETSKEVIEQQKKLTGILDNSSTVIYMKDIEGRYLLVNKLYEKLFHIKNEDISGKTDFDIFPQEIARKLYDNDRQVLKNECSLHFEEITQLDDGLHTYVTVKYPVTDSKGDIYAIAGISTDITQRKKIEEELVQYKNKLESIVDKRTHELSETVKEMEAFSYSVSHDLRSPLRGINGFSLALQEDYSLQLDDTARDYLDRIIRATDRMGNIIDDLLLLSRVNRHEIEKTPVNLSKLAEKVMRQLQSHDPERQVNVNIQSDIFTKADTKLMILVLENILGNAWKYTSKSDQPNIQFGQTETADQTVFYVKDNGAGFDMKYANKLFKAFERLHGEEYEGTGIGLATVYRIIQRHNGKIWAESEVDRGSTFYFTLGE